MENIDLITDNAACGLTDISGVKESPELSVPEQRNGEKGHVAGDGMHGGEWLRQNESANVCGESMTGLTSTDKAPFAEESTVLSEDTPKSVKVACVTAEEENEDKEFLALIKGKYKNAYRRRTESIIRRRLKSVGKGAVKEESTSVGEPVENEKTVHVGTEGNTDGGGLVLKATTVGGAKPDMHLKAGSYLEDQKAVNRSRPRENGVGGSVGMFTGINVSALKGSDILDILRRAETGEKIKFQ